MTDGKKANKHGKHAHKQIRGMLAAAGVAFQEEVRVGHSIYDTDLVADFLISVPAYPGGLVIESKWQQSGGSLDKGYPYVVANIKSNCYTYPVVVVAAGGGATPGAITWLRAQVDGKQFVAVLDFNQLVRKLGEWTA